MSRSTTPPGSPPPSPPPSSPRWKIGDWEFDPKRPDWDNPKIKRLIIDDPQEYKALGDAVVRGASVCYCVIEDLRALVDAVQSHPDAKLARATKPDAKGLIHPDGVFRANARLPDDAEATELTLHACVVERCEFSDLDIGCTLTARVRFDRVAGFDGAAFAGDAGFIEAAFAGVARFEGAAFAGDAWFIEAAFAGVAGFDGAAFAGDAWFIEAAFAGDAWFIEAAFAGDAGFIEAAFAGVARFGGAAFAGDAWFEGAAFAGDAWFIEAAFAGVAGFGGAAFAGDARFGGAAFAGDAGFGGAAFAGDAQFDGVHVRRSATLFFLSVRIKQSLSFNKESDERPDERPSIIQGALYFTDSKLDERLTFDGALFGRDARLGFNRFLARAGATVELTNAQLTRNRHDRAILAYAQLTSNPHSQALLADLKEDPSLSSRRRRTPGRILAFALERTIVPCLRAAGLWRGAPLIKGEDTWDADKLDRGADDYEILASNYTRLPATDNAEDHCRWRAHDLRARSDLLRRLNRIRESRNPAAILWNSFLVIADDVFFRWLIMRNAIGYLLYLRRIVITGAVLIAGSAALYTLGASPNTIAYNGSVPNPLPPEATALKDTLIQGGYTPTDAQAYGLWLWNQPEAFGLDFSGFYFSLTTFVTLGYGDFAPLGWFKLVTGLEALFGVTLLALFTVAWGRKMVR